MLGGCVRLTAEGRQGREGRHHQHPAPARPASPPNRPPPSVPHPAYLRERGSGGDELDHAEVEEVCSLCCSVVRLCGLSQLLGGGGRGGGVDGGDDRLCAGVVSGGRPALLRLLHELDIGQHICIYLRLLHELLAEEVRVAEEAGRVGAWGCIRPALDKSGLEVTQACRGAPAAQALLVAEGWRISVLRYLQRRGARCVRARA